MTFSIFISLSLLSFILLTDSDCYSGFIGQSFEFNFPRLGYFILVESLGHVAKTKLGCALSSLSMAQELPLVKHAVEEPTLLLQAKPVMSHVALADL